VARHKPEIEIRAREGTKETAVEVDAATLRRALDDVAGAIRELKSRLPAGRVKVKMRALSWSPAAGEPDNQHYPPGSCDEPPLPPGPQVCRDLEELVRLLREVCRAVQARERR
jgi:hypothetical protein